MEQSGIRVTKKGRLMEYTVRNCSVVILIDGRYETEVVFEWPVAQVLECHGMLFVRIEPKSGACYNQNVFGINPGGEIAWQVPWQKHLYEDSPYTNIWCVEDGVALSNWDGLQLVVQPASGAIISKSHGK